MPENNDNNTIAAPTVAAGVPCYNAAQFVRPVLRSLLGQTRKPDAVYVVDDGSTDDTVRIVAEEFPEVKLLRHDGNKGLAVARNTMIAAVQEDILVSIDSDAPADSRLIERLLAGYDAPNVAGVGGKGIEVSRQSPADLWRGTHQFAQHWGNESLAEVWFLYGIVSSYRTSILREMGGFDTEHATNGEDVELGARLRKAGYVLRYRHDAVVLHQRRDDFRSLMRMVYRYCYGGFIGLLKNDMVGIRWGVMTGVRHFLQNLPGDVSQFPDFRQFLISLCAFIQEERGYLAARWELEKRRRGLTKGHE